MLNFIQLTHTLAVEDWDGTRYIYGTRGQILARCSAQDCWHYVEIIHEPFAKPGAFVLCHEHLVAIDGPCPNETCPLCDRLR